MRTPILAFSNAAARYAPTAVHYTATGTAGAYVVSWDLSTDPAPDAETETKEKSIALLCEGSAVQAAALIEIELEDGTRFTPAADAIAHGIRIDALDLLVQHYTSLGRKCPSWLVYEGIDVAAFEASLDTTLLDATLAAIRYPDAGNPVATWKTEFLAGTGPAAECVDDTRTGGEAPGTSTRQITLRAFHVEGEGTEAVTVEDDVVELIAALGALDESLAAAPPVVAASTALAAAPTFKAYVSFVRWQPAPEASSGTTDPKGSYEPLPVDTVVRVVDVSGSSPVYLSIEGTIGSDGLVHWNRGVGDPESDEQFIVNKSDFTSSVYFLVTGLPASPEFRFHDTVVDEGITGTEDTTHASFSWTDDIGGSSTTVADAWGTKDLKSVDGATSGTIAGLSTLAGTALGSSTSPLTFPVGVPVHARFRYSKGGGIATDTLSGSCPMPPGIPVRLVMVDPNPAATDPKVLATFFTDKQGQIDGTVNNWTAGTAGVEFQLGLSIRDDGTGLGPLELTLVADISKFGGALGVSHTTVSHRYITTDADDDPTSGWGLGPWEGTTRNQLSKGRIGDLATPAQFLLGSRAVANPTTEDDLHARNTVCGAFNMLRVARATYNWFDAVTESFDSSSAHPRMRTLMSTNLYAASASERVTWTLKLDRVGGSDDYGAAKLNPNGKTLILRLYHTPPDLLEAGDRLWNTAWSNETISHETTHALMYVAMGATLVDHGTSSAFTKWTAILDARSSPGYDGPCRPTSEHTALFEGFGSFGQALFEGPPSWKVQDVDLLKKVDTMARRRELVVDDAAKAAMYGAHQTPTPERPGTATQPTTYTRSSVYVEDFKYKANLSSGSPGDWFYPIDESEFKKSNKWIVFEGTNSRDDSRTVLVGTKQRWTWFHVLRTITDTGHFAQNPGQLYIGIVATFFFSVLRNTRPSGTDTVVRDFDAPGDVSGDTMTHAPYFDSTAPVVRIFSDSGSDTEDWDATQFLESGDSERARRLFRRIYWGPLMHLADPANWEALQFDFTEPFVQRWWDSQAAIDAIDSSSSHRCWPATSAFFAKLVSDYDALSGAPSFETDDRSRAKKWLNFLLLFRNP